MNDPQSKVVKNRSILGAISQRGRKKTPCHLYVPAIFDATKELPPELHRYADCARYFLHRIYWGRVQKRTTPDGFVCLKWDYLRRIIPDRVLTPLKKALIDSNVIECDNRYIEGEKSFGYRLCSPFSESAIIRIAVEDEVTADRVRANRRAEYKKIRLDVHKYLRKKLWALEIDLPFALSLLKPHPEYDIVKIPAENISLRDFRFSVCRYGRVHTDLTRCHKVIRPALHVKGQHLVEIDIANSQPLFLSLLIINYRNQGNKLFKQFTKSGNPYKKIDELIASTVKPFPQKKKSNTTPSALPAYTTCKASREVMQSTAQTGFAKLNKSPSRVAVNRSHLSDDEQQFVRLCGEGHLYEELMERMELPFRKWVKQDFFEVLFGKNSLKSPLKEEFKELFPHVAEVIRSLKRHDYKFLPCLMQNIESNFVINTVCRRLMNEIPDAPVFTIHDSILTTNEFADEVQQIMSEEFQGLGLSPKLHRKDYGRWLQNSTDASR
jgi:hypothetical protein